MYTTHGHHIPGTPWDDIKDRQIAHCGGLSFCDFCKSEAASAIEAVDEFNKHTESSEFDLGYPNHALALVKTVIDQNHEKTDPPIDWKNNSLFVVWFSKTLQNWKALVSTTLPDGKYYEVTYNGDKQETYVDTYVKVSNVCFPQPPL